MRTVPRRPLALAAVVLVLFAAACGKKSGSDTTASSSPGGGAKISLAGAGATFPEPLYVEWISKYRSVAPDVQINYQGIGSGGGVEQYIAKTIDFAGTDAFLSDDEIKSADKAHGCTTVHIPTVFGAVAVPFNLKGVSDITLDGTTLADIFLGKVKTWNDPAIKALNGSANLPASNITVVHRSDGSGTTSIFTNYLADVSSEWKSKVGAGKEVQWPTGVGGQGNDGVGAAIQQNPGSIGYVELSYVLSSDLTSAKLKNKDDKAIAPTIDSTIAAANTVTPPADLRFKVAGVGGDGYPIVGATWILAAECGYDAAKADALKAFLHWAIEKGDATARELHYAPVSGDLEQKSLANVDLINSKA